MVSNKKSWSACWTRASSSTLLLLMIPLVVISGFVSVLGPKSSNWVSMSNYTRWNSSSSAAEGDLKGISVISTPNDDNGVVGLRSNLLVVDNENNIEEAVISAYESPLNRSSSSSPLNIIEVDLSQSSQEHNMTKEESSSTSDEAGDVVVYLGMNNESDQIPPIVRARRQRVYTKLERLEGSLIRARSVISEAKIGNQTQDSQYTPDGPMYWNPKAFHRSYLEMERQFKVFVYEEGEPPLFHNGPCKSIYSMEGNFIHELEMNRQFRTKDPQKAHVFFLPFSVTMLVRYVYVRDSHDFSPIRQTVIDYVDVVSGKYPFWNRSLGADHFMLSCHDWGPEASSSVPNLRKNSIRVLCNANTSEGFNPTKDVSFPEINLLTGLTDGFLGGPSASKRPILAFFAGGVHGPIRPILLEHWENKDEDMKIHQYLPKGVSYYDMLRKSKYCICPSGYEVASPRIVEAIYTGCVPVLISDHYVPPFSDVINWKSFSVEVPVSEIQNLKKILMSISPRQYIRMQRRVIKVRKHFEVNSPPKRFDVFHMILHSVWLRRLNIRVREDL
ncbi:probable glycosyltransferase At5g03795 isoform X2 [Humulus lupulus]|uniref:probable glycosyltransferase At5g03795 isoform X2 n=1 Tax=Humulus lupulus TaxID=3486 RepID=UPI002B408208|nr:probable glycosyltransferase At5g03795 isoform X2 [Humulus lupulus]